jgi:DNA-binding LacI/PurR family transcriptional regulator
VKKALDKRVTSADVARAAGVSRTTVSFVLNNKPGFTIGEETRSRVLAAADRLGYRPHASARRLAAGRSDLVLLSLPDLPIGVNVARFAERFAAALAESGLTVVAHLAALPGPSLPDVCAEIDAAAVVSLTSLDEETHAALRQSGAQVVLMPDDAADAVQEQIGWLQARHLIERGHRRLGYADARQTVPQRMAHVRLRGAIRACAEAGLEEPLTIGVNLDADDAAEAVSRWRAASVTGVCACNDETALAVLAGARESGLDVPGDLAVVGCDDIAAARLAAPPLSTVVFDLEAAGKQAAHSVLQALEGRAADVAGPGSEPHLLIRRST